LRSAKYIIADFEFRLEDLSSSLTGSSQLLSGVGRRLPL